MEHQEHHEHDGCCTHDHGHDDGGAIRATDITGQHADTAAKSLAEALRWSFIILSGAMILVVVAFLFSGVKQVKNQEVGIKKVFGRIVGEVEPGLAITWPFPVGQIETVNIQPQTVMVDDFWMNVLPEDATRRLAERGFRSDTLQPGLDGALLTGDRSLLHVRLEATFAIAGVRQFKQNIPGEYYASDAAGKDRLVQPAKDIVRSAVCTAALRAAASQTAENIQKNQGLFLTQVKIEAQKQLDSLQTGLRISNVSIPSDGISWPMMARLSYDDAQKAERKKDATIADAMANARKLLLDAAGGSGYRPLVGDPSIADKPAGADGGDYDLIGQFIVAREKGQADQADALLKKIDDVLVSTSTGGAANRVIEAARTSATTISLGLKARSERFNEIYAEYQKNPRLMLGRLWAEAREEILSGNASLVKLYTNTDGGPTTILINLDPDMMRAIHEQAIKAKPADSR